MINYPRYTKLPEEYIKSRIEKYLLEDAPQGDYTTLGTIHPNNKSTAVIQAEEGIVVAGIPIIRECFKEECFVEIKFDDGKKVTAGSVIAEIIGPSQYILTRERVILNLLQRLSGIATLTSKYVEIASKYNVKVLDTRKTTPGMRLFEKYAVASGGGYNHRLDLSSGILIKDNHIKAAGSIAGAIEKIKERNFGLPIELEVDTFDQINEGLEAGADGFLLDNMSPSEVRRCVDFIRSAKNGDDIFIEASGGINLSTLEGYAAAGVNAVSIGALTHSVKSSEIHMEFI